MTLQEKAELQAVAETNSHYDPYLDGDGLLETEDLLRFLHDRYSEVTARTANKAAKDVRAALLNEIKPPNDPDCRLNQLPSEARALLEHLDLKKPRESVAFSIYLSDIATEKMPAVATSPMEVAGAVSACISRELWELPACDRSAFQTNLTLSKLMGTYFTPPNVAWYIAVNGLGRPLADALRSNDPETIAKASCLRVLDPACGNGYIRTSTSPHYML